MKVLVIGATWSAGMAVIRGLARAGYKVMGADTRRLFLNAHSRFTKSFTILPENDQEFLAALIKLLTEEEPDVLIPVNETRLISRYKKELKAYTRLLVPDNASYEAAFDNKKLAEECRSLRIAGPRILSDEEAKRTLKKSESGGPSGKVVIKPRGDVGGARGVHFVENYDSLMKLRYEIEKFYGKTFVQEYIPGDESVRTLNVLFDEHSELVGYFTMRKIRQWPRTGGITVLGVSTREWELVERVLPFFQRWRWQGPAEVEFKVDCRDNEPKVIEINPRFPGYIGLLIKCGVDFPTMVCELCCELEVSYKKYPDSAVGVKYLDPVCYAKLAIEDLIKSKKRRTISQVLSELRGKNVTNNGERSDWLVILAKLMTKHKTVTDRSLLDVWY